MLVRRIVLALLVPLALIATLSGETTQTRHRPREALHGPLSLQLAEWQVGPALEAQAAQNAAEAAQAEADRVAAEQAQSQAATTIPRPVTAQTTWASSVQPCGGDLPSCCIVSRESGGDYNVQNPNSTASGKYQFLDTTWAGFGGYARAYLAPPGVQDAKARLVWASSPSAWAPLC